MSYTFEICWGSMYKQLLIYVEGINDRRFLDKVIVPKFGELGYDHVSVEEYKGDGYKGNCKKISDFIKNIKKIDDKPNINFHYIFLTDHDNYPSIQAKKDAISSRIRHIEDDKIVVVIIEIEAWYLAGLDENASRKHQLPHLQHTNDITKEKFEEIIPKAYKKLEIPFRLKILEDYCLETAKTKNDSFKYFHDKFLI